MTMTMWSRFLVCRREQTARVRLLEVAIHGCTAALAKERGPLTVEQAVALVGGFVAAL